jgi:transcriptional regulator with XRE-family HTH domain
MRGAYADGERIRTARVGRGLTQEQLATRADVDVKTVRKAEQGKRLDVGTLARIALALGADVRSLVRASNPESDLQSARRRAVECWQAAWDARDMEAILALYHEDAVLHLPGGPHIAFSGAYRGKNQIRRANELAWSTAQTVPQRPQDYSLIVSGDTVVLHGVRGLYLPGGEAIWLTNTYIFTFQGDLIVEHRVEYDTLGFSQALHLPPTDTSPG